MIENGARLIVTAGFFAAAAFLGLLLAALFCERVPAPVDAPARVRVHPGALVAAAAGIGALISMRGPTAGELLLCAFACLALAAIWVTDAQRGLVPDLFTIGPLGAIAVASLLQHHWLPLVSASITFAPFAVVALATRGRGLGWGDVKLAALGGALLGVQMAVAAFIIASLTAAVWTYARGKRGEAVAFAPYMASAIGLGLPLAFWV